MFHVIPWCTSQQKFVEKDKLILWQIIHCFDQTLWWIIFITLFQALRYTYTTWVLHKSVQRITPGTGPGEGVGTLSPMATTSQYLLPWLTSGTTTCIIQLGWLLSQLKGSGPHLKSWVDWSNVSKVPLIVSCIHMHAHTQAIKLHLYMY